MRHSKTEGVGNILRQLLKQYNLDSKLVEVRAVNAWGELFGPAIVKYTDKVEIRNRVLYVKLTSSVVRNELLMQRAKIVEVINEHVGTSVIDKVVLR